MRGILGPAPETKNASVIHEPIHINQREEEEWGRHRDLWYETGDKLPKQDLRVPHTTSTVPAGRKRLE